MHRGRESMMYQFYLPMAFLFVAIPSIVFPLRSRVLELIKKKWRGLPPAAFSQQSAAFTI